MDRPVKNEVVQLTDVCYQFPGSDKLALCVPSLSIAEREHTAITGPSGCGKTTLLRLIAGVLIPQQGSVQTLGNDTNALDTKARGQLRLQSIGMVFQELALLDYLTAFENILLTARLGKFDLDLARAHAVEIAERAGIKHTLHRRPNQLSQGERQRVAICRALLTNPRLIICDEPTGNLDSSRSKDIIELVMSEATRLKATVITVTHDISVIGQFHRRVDLHHITSLEGAHP